MLEFIAETAKALSLEDYRVLCTVGPSAGQTVFHLHWHLLGGAIWASGCRHWRWPRLRARSEMIKRIETELADAIRAHDELRRDTLRLMLASLRSAEKELLRRSRRRGASGAAA